MADENRIRIRDQRRERMRELDEEGVPRAQIARELGISRQAVTKALGPMERDSETKVKEMHIYCDPDYFQSAADIALSLGLTKRGGNKSGGGNVGKIIDMIGSGKMELVPVDTGGSL